MSRASLYVAALTAALSLSLTIPSALACSCAMPPDAETAAGMSALVVEAKLVSGPLEAEGMHQYTFDVVRTFKGEPGSQIVISTRMHGAACGRTYDKTVSSWLIYAPTFEDGVATDNICTRTRTMESGAEDVAALGGGSVVAPPDGKTDGGDEATEEVAEVTPEEVPEATPEEVAEATPEPEPEPEPAEPADDDVSKPGCSMASGAASWLALLPLAGLIRRRR